MPVLEYCRLHFRSLSIRLLFFIAPAASHRSGKYMSNESAFSADEQMAALQALAGAAPTPAAAMAQIARLRGELNLPRGAVHVISDVHGEDKKLRHIINNASGTLRPLVERLFRDRFTADELRQFVTLLFYPAEIVAASYRRSFKLPVATARAGRPAAVIASAIRAAPNAPGSAGT